MRQHQAGVSVSPKGRGLTDITGRINSEVAKSGITTGMCFVYITHTSASLVIQENADPSAGRDLVDWFHRNVPESDPHYTHTAEGPDDMPAHIKAALTSTSEAVPVVEGRLGLGTWQGLYLFEHRDRPSARRLIVHVMGR